MVLYHGDHFFFHVFNILLSSVESMPGTVISARATMAFATPEITVLLERRLDYSQSHRGKIVILTVL